MLSAAWCMVAPEQTGTHWLWYLGKMEQPRGFFASATRHWDPARQPWPLGRFATPSTRATPPASRSPIAAVPPPRPTRPAAAALATPALPVPPAIWPPTIALLPCCPSIPLLWTRRPGVVARGALCCPPRQPPAARTRGWCRPPLLPPAAPLPPSPAAAACRCYRPSLRPPAAPLLPPATVVACGWCRLPLPPPAAGAFRFRCDSPRQCRRLPLLPAGPVIAHRAAAAVRLCRSALLPAAASLVRCRCRTPLLPPAAVFRCRCRTPLLPPAAAFRRCCRPLLLLPAASATPLTTASARRCWHPPIRCLRASRLLPPPAATATPLIASSARRRCRLLGATAAPTRLAAAPVECCCVLALLGSVPIGHRHTLWRLRERVRGCWPWLP